jgi:hypothetical protein
LENRLSKAMFCDILEMICVPGVFFQSCEIPMS